MTWSLRRRGFLTWVDWTTYFATRNSSGCNSFDPQLVAPHKDYVLATWWSHYRAWERIADRFRPTITYESQRVSRTASLLAGNDTERVGLEEPRVLILEDDVDWELDVKDRLSILMDAAAAPRPDEYGDGKSQVVGWDLFYPGWCFEFGTEKPFEVPGFERVYAEVEVPANEWDGEKIKKRKYQIARPIFPACLQWVSIFVGPRHESLLTLDHLQRLHHHPHNRRLPPQTHPPIPRSTPHKLPPNQRMEPDRHLHVE
jgi:hypothetical protein